MNDRITFTRKEIDELSKGDMNRVVMVKNDGQGDTNILRVSEFRKQCEEDNSDYKNYTNSEFIDDLWEDTNPNMTTFIWIEVYDFKEIQFLP
jgi:hypothetical protein